MFGLKSELTKRSMKLQLWELKDEDFAKVR